MLIVVHHLDISALSAYHPERCYAVSGVPDDFTVTAILACIAHQMASLGVIVLGIWGVNFLQQFIGPGRKLGINYSHCASKFFANFGLSLVRVFTIGAILGRAYLPHRRTSL